MDVLTEISHVLGYMMVALISLINIRFLLYFHSFFFRWPRYRQREVVTTNNLQKLPMPFVKIQITTRGSPGSSEVIRRAISYVMQLAQEFPTFYGYYLSVEVVTESEEQKHQLRWTARTPGPVISGTRMIPRTRPGSIPTGSS